jgi:mono/diheme cytochrome c family protein
MRDLQQRTPSLPDPQPARGRRPAALLGLGLALLGAQGAEGAPARAPSEDAAGLVEAQCASCHRFEGEPGSKFDLEAPDLMWAGQKYRRRWLLRFLKGEAKSPYPLAYRWDQADAAPPHPTLSAEEARRVADWLEQNARSPLVKEGAFDPSALTEIEVRQGARLYQEMSCAGCHQIPGDEGPVGGPSSTHFLDAGRRYDPDWLYAFNLEPPAFAPHSGEYEPDATERQVRWVTGYLLTLGRDDVEYARPWEGEAFETAKAERGEEVFETYCAQCHGLEGGGDGPAASGLEPRPAKLAEMRLDQLELRYLYEIVSFGGKAVGKSQLMPDWSRTLSEQQIADVLTYLRETFDGPETTAEAVCPQPRATASAPPEMLERENPLEATPENLAAARELYQASAQPLACAKCHGEEGDGLGPLASAYDPPPRNFTCAETMNPLPDGQLYWIIENGALEAGMPPYATLSEEEIWQLVLLVRSFSD